MLITAVYSGRRYDHWTYILHWFHLIFHTSSSALRAPPSLSFAYLVNEFWTIYVCIGRVNKSHVRLTMKWVMTTTPAAAVMTGRYIFGVFASVVVVVAALFAVIVLLLITKKRFVGANVLFWYMREKFKHWALWHKQILNSAENPKIVDN